MCKSLSRSAAGDRQYIFASQTRRNRKSGNPVVIKVENKSPNRAFTTERMIQYERDNVAEMQRGQGQNGPLVNPQTWQHVQESHAHLSPNQRAAVEQIVSGRDKIM